MSNEAMKLGLEALKRLWLLGDHVGTIANPAIKALEEALKQWRGESTAWPCEIETADFEKDTITLKMQSNDYKVSAGQHWLSTSPPDAKQQLLIPSNSTELEMQEQGEPVGDLAEYVIGCFRAAEAEGLQEALTETTDERLKDLVERRLMHAFYKAQEPQQRKPLWIDANDKTQAKFLPNIGEPVLFCHSGKTYPGKHTGGSFQSGHGVTSRYFDTWECRWMYLPAAHGIAPQGGDK